MLGMRFAKLIECHSVELAEGLVLKLQSANRTEAYRNIPASELQSQLQNLYRNLSLWLTAKPESEIKRRYQEIGTRRAEQGVPVEEFAWALMIAKEHVWHFLQREAMADQAMQLQSELDFVLSLDQFFDRALYYGIRAFNMAISRQAA
jgi:hypothetical protein